MMARIKLAMLKNGIKLRFFLLIQRGMEVLIASIHLHIARVAHQPMTDLDA